jgi:hypothetical protein
MQVSWKRVKRRPGRLTRKIRRMKANFWDSGIGSRPRRMAIETPMRDRITAAPAYLDCGTPTKISMSVIFSSKSKVAKLF